MAVHTAIEWTSATWNAITGCSIKSPGCNGCYAMTLAATRLRNIDSRRGLTKQTKTGPVWTGEVRFNEQWLDQPLQWKAPRDIFAVAHGDLFHENVPFAWIDRVVAVMILARRHRFQVLTKRTARMLEYFSGGRDLYTRVLNAARPLRDRRPELGDIPIDDPGAGAWHRNIWLGTSVERQQEADERRAPLGALATMGWNTWVSYEPALGMVDWSGWEFIRWLVAGGESGPRARPSHPDWYRAARDFCAARGIPFFMKQWGAWWPEPGGGYSEKLVMDPANHHTWDEAPPYKYSFRRGKKAAGRLLDGREWNETPCP